MSRIQILEWFAYWKKFCLDWLHALGMKDDEIRYRDHSIRKNFRFTVKRLQISSSCSRLDGENSGESQTEPNYDLTQHMEVSKQDLDLF